MSPNHRTLFQRFDAASGEHAKAQHKSFDCNTMDQSDDIVYGVHDLEAMCSPQASPVRQAQLNSTER
ncbi:dGTP triphosphohydrolase [Bradyrhizobium sp. USDA 3397]